MSDRAASQTAQRALQRSRASLRVGRLDRDHEQFEKTQDALYLAFCATANVLEGAKAFFNHR